MDELQIDPFSRKISSEKLFRSHDTDIMTHTRVKIKAFFFAFYCK